MWVVYGGLRDCELILRYRWSFTPSHKEKNGVSLGSNKSGGAILIKGNRLYFKNNTKYQSSK